MAWIMAARDSHDAEWLQHLYVHLKEACSLYISYWSSPRRHAWVRFCCQTRPTCHDALLHSQYCHLCSSCKEYPCTLQAVDHLCTLLTAPVSENMPWRDTYMSDARRCGEPGSKLYMLLCISVYLSRSRGVCFRCARSCQGANPWNSQSLWSSKAGLYQSLAQVNAIHLRPAAEGGSLAQK